MPYAPNKIKATVKILIFTSILFIDCITFAAPTRLAIEMINKGDSLYYSQQYIESLYSYIKALSHSSGKDDRVYYQAISRIGTIYDICGDQERALYYYHKVIDNCDHDLFPEVYAEIVIKMAICYCNKQDLENARKYMLMQKDYPLYDYKYREYYRYTNKGLVANLAGEGDIALRSLKKAIGIVRRFNMSVSNEIPIVLELGSIYKDSDMRDSAYVYFKRSEQLATENGLSGYITDAYKELSDYYMDEGDTVNALKYQTMYNAIADSIFSPRQLNKATASLLRAHDIEAKSEINRLESVSKQWS